MEIRGGITERIERHIIPPTKGSDQEMYDNGFTHNVSQVSICAQQGNSGKALTSMAAKSSASFINRYQRDTGEIIDLFMEEKLTFPECIGRLEAALSSLLKEIPAGEVSSIRDVIIANNEMVMEEMALREQLKAKAQRVDIND
jgi:hypothetical protein